MDIFLSPPNITKREKEYVLEALESNWLAPNGLFVKKLETSIAQRLRSPFCIATQSGTAALHLILRSLKLNRNDVVFCPTHSFIASANPIVYEQAIPYFIDCEKYTFAMDVHLLELAIKEVLLKKLRPKAVIVTHLYGMPAHYIFEIKKLCETYHLILIEDAAESIGASIDNQFTGSIGDYGVLSFNSNKIITTGGGGAVLCKSEESNIYIRFLANQAKENSWHYKHKEIGYNYLMSNIPAAIGCAQIEQLDTFIEKRKKIHLLYSTYLNDCYSIHNTHKGNSNYWLTVLKIKKNTSVESLLRYLHQHKIDARALWKSLHAQPLYLNAYHQLNHTSDDLFENHLLLPTGTDLTEMQIQTISKLMNTFN